MPERIWTQDKLIASIRDLHEQGVDLSPTSIQRTHSAIFASARSRSHFGNWRDAVEASGLNYDEIKRVRRRWSHDEITRCIRDYHDHGEDLMHPDFRAKRYSLYSAACSRRYFGSWKRALISAGLDHEKLRETRMWTRARILRTIQEMAKEGKSLNWTHIKDAAPGLYRAARRRENFGSWHEALIAAGITPGPLGRGRRPNAVKRQMEAEKMEAEKAAAAAK